MNRQRRAYARRVEHEYLREDVVRLRPAAPERTLPPRTSLSQAEAMTAKCPVCLALPEEPCRSTNARFPGRPTSPHIGRVAAARRS